MDPRRSGPDDRRRRALRLAVHQYAAQVGEDRRYSVPALLLPGLAGILTWFCPALVVGAALGAFQGGARPTLGQLSPYLLALAGVWLVGEAGWRAGIHYLNRAGTRGASTLYVRAMDDLFAKDLAFFHDNFAGSLTKKVTGYASSYLLVLDTLAYQVTANLLPLGFVCVVLWRYSPWLVVTLVTMISLTGIAIAPLIAHRQDMVNAREVAANDLAGHVADTMTNMDAVRLFSREPEEAATHAGNVDRWRALALRSWDYQNRRIDLVTGPFYILTNLAGIVLAVTVADSGRFNLEAVFVTFVYYTRVTQVVWQFNQIYRMLETHLSTAAQFTELLLDPPSVTDPPVPAVPAFRDASVEFRDLWFAYPTSTGPLFRGLDLRIDAGEKVGLVGRSGAGKSSLTRLLLRLADVTGGVVLLGGQDVASVRQADLRSQIAYVPQDPVMFHRSVRENIAFGRSDATDEEIRTAAELSHAAEFIDGLPHGYETIVGERGVKLSGGQRQRVAIARALLRQAPIVVLDEATSSLDSESEAIIQRALLTLMDGRTAIVIAHRLSTVRAMDRLIVLDDGEVVEDGSHEQLLDADGLYATLWRRQSGGFLGDAQAAVP